MTNLWTFAFGCLIHIITTARNIYWSGLHAAPITHWPKVSIMYHVKDHLGQSGRVELQRFFSKWRTPFVNSKEIMLSELTRVCLQTTTFRLILFVSLQTTWSETSRSSSLPDLFSVLLARTKGRHNLSRLDKHVAFDLLFVLADVFPCHAGRKQLAQAHSSEAQFDWAVITGTSIVLWSWWQQLSFHADDLWWTPRGSHGQSGRQLCRSRWQMFFSECEWPGRVSLHNKAKTTCCVCKGVHLHAKQDAEHVGQQRRTPKSGGCFTHAVNFEEKWEHCSTSLSWGSTFSHKAMQINIIVSRLPLAVIFAACVKNKQTNL